ncbi:MAG: Transposase [Clostridiales bacterium 38_11]|nr:MAG: Transposase [Clostridiales bacterium 38_11]
MDDKTRNAIALKKFSIISPVLNGQVPNNAEYFRQVASKPIDMPHYGMRRYSYKTLESWLCDYNKQGLDGLARSFRSDRGKSRKISAELGEEIAARRKANPKVPITVLYEQMVAEGMIDPTNISRPTVYRFIEDLSLAGEFGDDVEKPESLRFSHENVGDLWQGDVMYGPYITIGKRKHQTYLHMFIDDASRYPVYSQFYLSQNFETLRHCFKEAILRRGIPRLVYTDNAKIYRSQQFEYICASLGCTLLHSQPFEPQGRGKVERMFRTVRMRFLSMLDPATIKDIDALNQRYFKWLEEDYIRKAHSGLRGQTPHDVLMAGVSNLKLVTDTNLINECFLLRITRKIQHDATTQINNVLYETDTRFAGKRVEIRYEPEWINDVSKALPIYSDGKKVGEAKVVRFHDNSHVKRRFKGNRRKEAPPENQDTAHTDKDMIISNTISYYGMEKGESDV